LIPQAAVGIATPHLF